MNNRVLQQLFSRLDAERSESDTTLFHSLLYFGEAVSKMTVALFVAAIPPDEDRTAYRLLHRLLRSNGLGDWPQSLEQIVMGPPSELLVDEVRNARREYSQKFAFGEWQSDAVASLVRVLDAVGVAHDIQSGKLSLRTWFPHFAALRNKTRGHGALRSSLCAEVCPDLEQSIRLIAEHFSLFDVPLVHLKRNLSGKYRVSPIAGDISPFEPLRTSADYAFSDGVYCYLDRPRPVALIHTDADLSDVFLPNGDFRNDSYEVLSYITGNQGRRDASGYSTPIESLPRSETRGTHGLEIVGSCFTNMPAVPEGYVERSDLEASLREQIALDQHPIISLTGPGGIGKTSLALKVLHDLACAKHVRFGVLLWLSSRDIDLSPHGPKQVRPDAINIGNFAAEVVRLLNPLRSNEKGFQPTAFLAELLASGEEPAVFVFDNFETVADPGDVYRWIDTYIRPPNKVVITTRIRDFRGDYPIAVPGMSLEETRELVANESGRLGVGALITSSYLEELHREADGHPYVMKILLGECAREKRVVKPQRIVASRSDILGALFERTFDALSPAAQRLFLVLSRWRSVVPEVALEAVMLRSDNERIPVEDALDELKRFSLIEEVSTTSRGNEFLAMPLAASIFGRKKLHASPMRAQVEADSELLQAFGAATRGDVSHGVRRSVRNVLRRVAEQVERDGSVSNQYMEMLEFLGSRVPEVRLDIALLFEEIGGAESIEKAKGFIRKCLEDEAESLPARREAWERLAKICRDCGDHEGEINAAVGMAECAVTADDVVAAGQRVNMAYKQIKMLGVKVTDFDEKRILLGRVANAFRNWDAELTATDMSVLGWIHLQRGDLDSARVATERGLELDPENHHCLGLRERFV